MAFFGLTSLGLDRPFRGTLPSAFNVSLFSQEEWAAAAARHSDAEGRVNVHATLTDVFKGPLPPAEAARVAKYFGDVQAATLRSVALDDFLAGIKVLADSVEQELDAQRAIAAHYDSLAALQEHRARGVHIETPPQVYSAPLTLAQEVGWRGHETPLGATYASSTSRSATGKP